MEAMAENTAEVFNEIGPGMTPEEVQELLGNPTRVSEQVVPDDSGWQIEHRQPDNDSIKGMHYIMST